MPENGKNTGKIGPVFRNIGQKIAGLFKFKADNKDSKRERTQPVFPPAGPFVDGKRQLKDTDKTVIFTENELKPATKKQKFADTMQVPGITDADYKSKKSGGSLFVPRTKRPNIVLGVVLTSFKFGFVAIFIIVAIAAGLVLGLANAYLETTPDLDVGKIQNQALSSYIYDQQGTLLATYTGSENRDWATLDQIPVDLQHAFVAKEDIRFYSHTGVDVIRLFGALVSNLTSSNVTGGSTITQQLIKNSILTNERSYKRKLQEAYLAIQLEKKYTKDQILEAYLNTIPLGGTIYGVKTAAKEYFGKDLNQLNLKEIVCLTAITESPNQYSPYRATYVTKDVGNLQNKMNEVTQRMYAAGFITKQQYDDTFVPQSVWSGPDFLAQWKSTMNVLQTSPSNSLYPYPHFVEYVVYDVETEFLRKENMDDTAQNRAIVDNQIRQNGYKIYATIDESIQNTVQSTISQWNKYPAFTDPADNVKKQSDGSEITEPQASAVVIDNATGYIVAMVGSRDTPTAAKTLNRAVDAPMPVGSSIKPLTVYGPAFDLGLSPATPIPNVPVPINGWDSPAGYPLTSGGTPGPTPIRTGLVNSWNIVAARTLMDDVGLSNSASYLQKLGVDMNNVNVDGVGLALGSSGLTTLEMAGGYAAIANNGMYREPVAFTKVEDKNGNVVLDSNDYRKTAQVYKTSSAWLLVDVLSQAVREGTGRNAQIPGITVAGKTGTVVDNKGVFFAGMTGYYTSTLWVGSDDYKAFVSGVAASNSSAPLWQSYMSKIYADKGLGDKPIIDKSPEEEGLIKVNVDAITGGAPVPGIPINTDWGTVQPTKQSDVFKQALVDTSTNMLAGPYCPPSVVQSEFVAEFPADNPYAVWLKSSPTGLSSSGVHIVDPNVICTVHTAQYRDSVTYAQSVVIAANALLTQYAGLLPQATVNDISSTIQVLQAAMNDPNSSDETINTPANILLGKVNAARAAITAPPPAATTQPASTSTPTPSPSGISQ